MNLSKINKRTTKLNNMRIYISVSIDIQFLTRVIYYRYTLCNREPMDSQQYTHSVHVVFRV